MLNRLTVIFRPACIVLLYQYFAVTREPARAQSWQTPEPEEETTLPNLKEMWLRQVEKMQREYNPNPGYEPYWPGGDWVHEIDPNASTTKIPLVCGEECNYLYREVQQVCGRRVDALDYRGCNPILLLKFCYGDYIDDLNPGFRTFPTYCEFLDTQCRRNKDELRDRWILVHRGPCAPQQNLILKPMDKSQWPLDRLHRYLSTMRQVFQNASLPVPFEDK